MTRVWLVLVASLSATSPSTTDSRAFVMPFALQLGRDAALRHYSRDRIMSVVARSTFFAPDLLPLPSLGRA